jgi:nicotinamidase-related amidase
MRQALLIIDVQEALIAVDPLNKDILISNLHCLIDKAKEQDWPVFFIRHNEPGDKDFGPGSYGWQIYHEFTTNDHEMIIDKFHNSAFHQTSLHEKLQQLNLQHLIITGMQTEYCVDATIKSAFDLGYHLTIIEDANSTCDNSLLTAVQLHQLYNHMIWPFAFGHVITLTDWLLQLDQPQ